MTRKPEIAVLVSSFERPGHLSRVLASIAAQRGVEGAFEVVVTDDGSRDETHRVVRNFAASVSFPVRFTTHPHTIFHLARCRNEGVAASTAPYLLFLDGDCVIPPDHLRIHLDRARAGFATAGYFVWLDRATSERITEKSIRSGEFQNLKSWSQRRQLAWRHLQASYYSLIRDPLRPKFYGGNFGLSRADYERVNGYDENYRGWGCEDDDLRVRLRAAGVRIASITWWTHIYHLWHPKDPSAGRQWRDGANVEYLRRPIRLTRCLSGLHKRRLQDLDVQLVGRRPAREVMDRLLPLWCRAAVSKTRAATSPAEVELAFAPGGGPFSKRCAGRVLVVPRGSTPTPRLVQDADLIFADGEVGKVPGRVFSLSALDGVLQRQLGASHEAAGTSRMRQAA